MVAVVRKKALGRNWHAEVYKGMARIVVPVLTILEG